MELSSDRVDQRLLEAVESGDIASVRGIAAQGADLDVKDDSGWTPLFHAVARRQLNVVHVLIELGVNAKVRDAMGLNAAQYAAILGDRTLLQALQM